jgi:hypothetical protein
VIAAGSTSFDIPTWVAIIVAVLGIVGTVAAAVAVFRQVAIKASLATIIEANAELRKSNDDLRRDLADERLARANLEGKLEVFTTHFAQQIIDIVTKTVQTTQDAVRAGARTRVGD